MDLVAVVPAVIVAAIALMIAVAARSRRRRRTGQTTVGGWHSADTPSTGPLLPGRSPIESPALPGAQSPLGPSSFDSLLEDLAARPGASWSQQSFVFDFGTGRWVDVTDTGSGGRTQPAAGARAEAGPAPPGDLAGKEIPRRSGAGNSSITESSSTLGPFGLLGTGGSEVEIQQPSGLPTFEDVGGMENLKQEIRDTIGLLLKHPEGAKRYGIEWNGILLHGPPGVGKTFFARAIAGEFGMNLMHVSTGDLVSSLLGESARNIDRAFGTAMQNLPCLLFFDEFDSVAARREDVPDQESRRTVNQLLQSLEANRDERQLLVVGATNSIEHLDPAVVRPGRFDRHIRIDLPDARARRAVLVEELDDRPAASEIDLDRLVRRTEGMTPAAISKVVDTAALEVFKAAALTGQEAKIDDAHLVRAVERYGGQDRPTVEHWTWDSLVLAPAVKSQLQQVQAVIEDPEIAQRFGVEPPSGLLLAGPPGTGKTSIARVLAAQARCSFYPISGADVMSKWVGESERNIRRVFERARDNRPSIIFIDEIDAIAGRRGELGMHDSQVNQLLAEIDGMAGRRGVLIIGATNRPDQLDPALLRGGRLSRTFFLGLPDEAGRIAILRLNTARMPTVGVRLEEIARDADGFSPADLKALCQEAALAALARSTAAKTNAAATSEPPPAITHADFEEALTRHRKDG